MTRLKHERQRLEHGRLTTNLKHYEETLIKRLEILKLYKQYSKIAVNSEINGLQNKINRCRQSLGLPLLTNLDSLPKRPIPISIQNALLNRDTPLQLRKSLEHPSLRRGEDSCFWGHEKTTLRKYR